MAQVGNPPPAARSRDFPSLSRKPAVHSSHRDPGPCAPTPRNPRVPACVSGERSPRGCFGLGQVLREVQEAEGKVILFIDEIHLVLGAGRSSGESGMDAANLLKPMLARGSLRCIGATTLNEYRQYIEKDSAFERRFQQARPPSRRCPLVRAGDSSFFG